MRFGELIKKHRLALGQSLREFCLANGFDPGNYSRLERGLFPPPQDKEKLREYAVALQLKNGSSEWVDLFDRAFADRGVVPDDLMSDDNIVDKLPVLFRTMRAKQIEPEHLDELVKKIKES